jgi:hypothetical protein
MQAHIPGYCFERGHRLCLRTFRPVLDALHQFFEPLFHTGIIARSLSPTPLPLAAVTRIPVFGIPCVFIALVYNKDTFGIRRGPASNGGEYYWSSL